MHGGDIYRNQIDYDFSVNMNPFGIEPAIAEALQEAIAHCMAYPDLECMALSDKLCAYHGIEKEELLIGNGASELFMATVQALRPKKALLVAPGFRGYEHALTAVECAITYYEAKRQQDFMVQEDIMELLTKDVDICFLTTPNNPTGRRISGELLERIVTKAKENNIVVVLDECFVHFTEQGEQESLLQRYRLFSNLMVVRAFTKDFAIPGVRLGYAISSDRKRIERIRKQLPEWNVSMLAQAAGECAMDFMKQKSYWDRLHKHLKVERGYLTEELEKLGITVFSSEANYLLLHAKEPLYERLLEKRILIRDCSDYPSLGAGYYRIAVRTRSENQKLVETLQELIKK